VPDDQFQFDAERHAEFVALVIVLPRQFVAVESEFGRQLGPAIAPVVGEFRSAVAVRRLRVFRQRGFVCAGRIPVQWIICGWRLQL
jgi:hypothetical protein